MASPETTLWKIEPHTEAKHEILRRYLDAWIPILSHGGFRDIIYYDGFAGPGEYIGGEEGSPLIALKALLEQRLPITAAITYHFVEKEKERADHLLKLLESIPIPKNVKVFVYSEQESENVLSSIVSKEENGRFSNPIFALLDPFGWKGVPFVLVSRVLQLPSSEILINFMYEEINRFLSIEGQKDNFTELFGGDEWRVALEPNLNASERFRALHDAYLYNLRTKGGAKYIRSFVMINAKNRFDYILFYATNSYLGLQKMKESMWKVDPTGQFKFADSTSTQLVLFTGPNFEALKAEIQEKFSGQEVTVANVEHFVISETAYLASHYKKLVLKPLEIDGKIEIVDPPSDRRKGTFADPKLVLRFKRS